MIERKGNDLLLDFRRGLGGKRFWDGKPVNETLQALFLEGPFVLVELAPGYAVAAAGFGDVTQSFSKL
jgi:hypothetical protein